MRIRKAEKKDLDQIMAVYDEAKAFMIARGNDAQWVGGYPQRTLIEEDIEAGQLYVCEEDAAIYGVFALIMGEDPTYALIENGDWKNDRPYGTIHRIGSNGKNRGIFKAAIDFCKTRSDELRIDTHEKNTIMRRLIVENGFEERGIIYIADGTPRIAYQYSAEE